MEPSLAQFNLVFLGFYLVLPSFFFSDPASFTELYSDWQEFD